MYYVLYTYIDINICIYMYISFHLNVHFPLLKCCRRCRHRHVYERMSLYMFFFLFFISCCCCPNQINSTCGVAHQGTVSSHPFLTSFFLLLICMAHSKNNTHILYVRLCIKKTENLCVFHLSQGIYWWMLEVSPSTTIWNFRGTKSAVDISIRNNVIYRHHWK